MKKTKAKRCFLIAALLGPERHIEAFSGPSLGVLVAAVVAQGGADVGVPGQLGDDQGVVARSRRVVTKVRRASLISPPLPNIINREKQKKFRMGLL